MLKEDGALTLLPEKEEKASLRSCPIVRYSEIAHPRQHSSILVVVVHSESPQKVLPLLFH
jgi:hypothetical protein